MLGYSFRDRLPEIEIPTMIVWGRNDILIPVDDAYEFERLIGANARLEIFDDTGHLADARAAVALQRPAQRLHRGTGTGAFRGVVIAPSEALATCAAYLASTPRVIVGAGGS